MDNLQCFNSLIFNSSKSPDSPNGSNRTPETSPRRVRQRPVNHASSVRFTANQDGFDDQNVPEGRVARAFRRQRETAPGNLSATAVQSSAHMYPRCPLDAGAAFGSRRQTPNMAHLPWMTSRSAFFSLPNGMIGIRSHPGRYRIRGDVSLDNLGDGLGLFVGEK